VSVKNEHGLTPRQERFAQEIGRGKCQAEAYRDAYPSSKKWKPDSVYAKSSLLAADVKVKTRVAQIQEAGAEMACLDVAEIAREIKRVAHSDIAGIMHDDGRVKLPHELDAATRAAVSSFKIDEYGRIEYKFWDKNTALTNAAKIKGMFKEDNKQKTDPLASLLQSLKGNVTGVADSADPGGVGLDIPEDE
jgi:phage terminase small subunit